MHSLTSLALCIICQGITAPLCINSYLNRIDLKMTQVMGYSKPRKRFNMHCSTIKMFLFEGFRRVFVSLFKECVKFTFRRNDSQAQTSYDKKRSNYVWQWEWGVDILMVNMSLWYITIRTWTSALRCYPFTWCLGLCTAPIIS